MIRILQIVSMLIVFVVAPICAADYFSGSGFLKKFMEDQSLSLMGTILAIYIAAASSFLAILLTHEKERGGVVFNSTTSELKQNIVFIILIFALHFFLLAGTPPETAENRFLIGSLMAAKVFTFSLYIFALYELSQVLFGIRDALNSNGDQK